MNNESVIFQEICDGSSKCKLDDLVVYIKHPMMNQQAIHKEVYEKWFDLYRKRGAVTNEEADKMIIENGDWTIEDDKIIKCLEDEIDRLKITAKAEKIPSRIMNINRQVEKAKSMLDTKIREKISLRPITAEMGAGLKLNDFVVVTSIFKDKDCNIRHFSDDDYEEMERGYIDSLNDLYSTGLKHIDEKEIQKLVLSDFFSPMFSLYANPKDFFDKSIVSLTRPQITLCFYTKIFKGIFENIPKIPKNITKDPEALLNFAENYTPSGGSDGKSSAARSSDVGGRMLVGVTKEDLESMRADGEIIGDLTEQTLKAAKDGGSSARLMDILNLS